MGWDQRLCFDHVRFISPNEDVKWVVRNMSLELSGRIRTIDTNRGVDMVIITGTKLRLWMGKSPRGLQCSEVKHPA